MKNNKKLIQINTVCNGSTGTIMGHIQKKAMMEGYDTLSLYGRRKGYDTSSSRRERSRRS